MLKAANPSITVAEKEKCLAMVKKHAPEIAMTTLSMETEKSHSNSSSRTHLIDKGVSAGTEVIDLTDESESNPSQSQCTSSTVAGTSSINISLVKTETNIKTEPLTASSSVGTEGLKTVVPKSEPSRDSVAMETETATTVVTSTTVISDVTKPLTIETKFIASPGPSSESTDTASEVGSCFSSPSSSTLGTSAQNSPNVPTSEKTAGQLQYLVCSFLFKAVSNGLFCSVILARVMAVE